jgi:type IV pilus assembly protein PilF
MRRWFRTASVWLALWVSVCGAGCATGKPEKATLAKADYHYQLGANFFRDQLIPQAINELETALGHDPGHADALHLLGFIYMGRRNYPQAALHFRKALEAREDFFICQNNLGTALMAMNRWDEAIVVFEGLVARPTYSTPELAYNNLGWSFHKKGEQSRAEEALEMAVFLKPEMCLAHNNLGLVQLAQEDTVGALKSFQKATQLCPNYPEPFFHGGQVLRAKEDPRAREYYQRCYDLAPESTWGERCMAYLGVYPR